MGEHEILKEIGSRINLKRKEMKLTQEELAERIDVSVQMISNLELGKKAVRPENIIKLCDALNISADYILRGKSSDFEISGLLNKLIGLSEEKRILVEKLIDAMN